MKNNIQRIIVMVAVVALSVSFLVFPASAAIDYNDLNPNIVVDGDNDIVTISVPASTFKFSLEDDATGYIERWNGTNKFSTCLDVFRDYNLYIFAFRNNGSYLDVTNIPDDTVMTFEYTISCTTMLEGWVSPIVQTQIWYLADGKQIGRQSVNQRTYQGESLYPLYGSFSYDMVMEKPAGAQEAFFRVVLRKFQSYEFIDDLNFSVDSFTLTFSISSLYRLQEQTGKTNEILKVVEKKLEENGQKLDDVIDKVEQNGEKLDDIISGTPEQNEQIDNAVGEMQGAVDRLEGLGNAMNSIERPDMNDIDISIDSFVPQTALLAYTAPILAFWKNDTLLGIVTMVATLVLVSWVFFGKKG